jgi:hypothetical protein
MGMTLKIEIVKNRTGWPYTVEVDAEPIAECPNETAARIVGEALIAFAARKVYPLVAPQPYLH